MSDALPDDPPPGPPRPGVIHGRIVGPAHVDAAGPVPDGPVERDTGWYVKGVAPRKARGPKPKKP